MTPAEAIDKAAEILERADCEPNHDMVAAKVQIADSWCRVAEAIAETQSV